MRTSIAAPVFNRIQKIPWFSCPLEDAITLGIKLKKFLESGWTEVDYRLSKILG
jgi:hypothetical protein